ncbi:MAG TPA: hypothetical protein VHG89_03030 [Verrucomicrobiae bacterium]|nr:hypothetical protein [Verrucomicrobiae bacterium]
MNSLRLVLITSITAILLAGCATKSPEKTTTNNSGNSATMVIAPLPEGITSFGAAVDDGWLYVFGGYTGKRHDYSIEKVRGAFYRLNLANDGQGQSWEQLPSSDPAQGTAIVAYGNYIYRVGGMAAKNHEGEEQDLFSQNYFERYDIQKKIWEKLAPMPEARSTHDAIVIGDKLYVGGGWDLNGDDPLGGEKDSGKWQDTLLVADLSRENLQWGKIPQPFKRRAIAMAAIGSKIYFIGGMDENNDTSRVVDIYDTANRVWSKGPDLPKAVMDGFGFAAVGVGDSIYASGFSGKLLRLSADGTKWETVGQLIQPRFFHRLILLGDGKLLAIGGESAKGKLNTLELLSSVPAQN